MSGKGAKGLSGKGAKGTMGDKKGDKKKPTSVHSKSHWRGVCYRDYRCS